jgi:hypothetical protein
VTKAGPPYAGSRHPSAAHACTQHTAHLVTPSSLGRRSPPSLTTLPATGPTASSLNGDEAEWG